MFTWMYTSSTLKLREHAADVSTQGLSNSCRSTNIYSSGKHISPHQTIWWNLGGRNAMAKWWQWQLFFFDGTCYFFIFFCIFARTALQTCAGLRNHCAQRSFRKWIDGSMSCWWNAWSRLEFRRSLFAGLFVPESAEVLTCRHGRWVRSAGNILILASDFWLKNLLYFEVHVFFNYASLVVVFSTGTIFGHNRPKWGAATTMFRLRQIGF